MIMSGYDFLKSQVLSCFSGAFVRMDAVNTPAKFEVRSFTVPEIIGGTKNLSSHWIRPRSLFSQIFNGLLFAWTL